MDIRIGIVLNYKTAEKKKDELFSIRSKDYLENDLEKISVYIFHAINENSKEKIHDVQIHTEQSSNIIQIVKNLI